MTMTRRTGLDSNLHGDILIFLPAYDRFPLVLVSKAWQVVCGCFPRARYRFLGKSVLLFERRFRRRYDALSINWWLRSFDIPSESYDGVIDGGPLNLWQLQPTWWVAPKDLRSLHRKSSQVVSEGKNYGVYPHPITALESGIKGTIRKWLEIANPDMDDMLKISEVGVMKVGSIPPLEKSKERLSTEATQVRTKFSEENGTSSKRKTTIDDVPSILIVYVILGGNIQGEAWDKDGRHIFQIEDYPFHPEKHRYSQLTEAVEAIFSSNWLNGKIELHKYSFSNRGLAEIRKDGDILDRFHTIQNFHDYVKINRRRLKKSGRHWGHGLSRCEVFFGFLVIGIAAFMFTCTE